jgi:hypothetical protein
MLGVPETPLPMQTGSANLDPEIDDDIQPSSSFGRGVSPFGIEASD